MILTTHTIHGPRVDCCNLSNCEICNCENARPAAEQSKLEVPTQSMIDERALTHHPYKHWCETCVMHKARQDAHVVQEHDKKQHSIISFDFGLHPELKVIS